MYFGSHFSTHKKKKKRKKKKARMVSLVMTQEIKPNELRAGPPTSSLDLWQEP